MATRKPLVNNAGVVSELITSDSLAVGGLALATTGGPVSSAGIFSWDDGNGTATIGLKGGNVTLQVGQEQLVRVFNGTGATLTDGQIVYITGAQGNRVKVALASNSSEVGSSVTIGMVTEPITAGTEGFVTTNGIVNGLNTSSLSEGAVIWLGATAGTYTTSKPTAPAHSVLVGYVVRSHASAGSIFVHIQNGYELDELHDVLISTKADNDLLQYDSASGLWKNTSDPFDLVNYPTIAPSLNLDFANSKQLDSRITFDRQSIGSYIDKDKLLKVANNNQPRFDHDPVTGECKGLLIEESRTNLITYSEQFDNNAWLKSSTIVIPNSTISPDGTLTADKLIESNNSLEHILYYPRTGLNETVTGSVYVKAGERNRCVIGFSNFLTVSCQVSFDLITGTIISTSTSNSDYTAPIGLIQSVGNGWYRCIVTVTKSAVNTVNNFYINTLLATNAAYQGDGTSGIYIWGAQLEAASFPTSYIPSTETFTGRTSTATYIGSDGLIKTAASGEARYNYNPTNLALAPKLLLEGQGTNLLSYSEAVNNWTLTNLTVSANVTISPDGTTSADKLVENSLFNYHYIVQYITPNAGVVTYSIFAKAAENSVFAIDIYNATDGTATIHYNVANGVKGTTYDNFTGTVYGGILPVGNGWYRCSISVTCSNVSTRFGVFLGDGTNETLNYLGDGVSGIYLWGAQVEGKTYPTSYIPTTTTSVTRNADTSTSSATTRLADKASITGSNFYSWYNQSEGTIVCEFNASQMLDPGSSYNRVIALENSAASTSLSSHMILFDNIGWTPDRLGVEIKNNNISQVDSTAGLNGYLTKPYSLANFSMAYKPNDVAISFNGASVFTDTSVIIPIVDSLYIGNERSGSFMTGYISKLLYYPKRLSNTILQTLTK